MRIAQMIDSLNWGGAQKLLLTLAEVAQPRHLDLAVISLQDHNDAPLARQIEALGVPVIFFPGRRLVSPGRFWQLVQFLRRERFHVLHTHLSYANMLGSLAGNLVGTPVVGTFHNVKVSMHPWFRRTLETQALRYGVHEIVAVGYEVAEARRSQFPNKPITVVPNAVTSIPPLPAAERIALRTEIAGDPDRLLLISVGRLTAQKGFSDLIDAFALLRQTHPAVVLAIAGGGELYETLVAQLRRLNLEGHVHLLGVRNDVPRLLAAADVFVSASHWEGLPVAVLEAMAAGLPVVATGVGEVPQVLIEGTGLVVSAHQPAELAATLQRLLANPEQRRVLGQAAQAHINAHYRADRWLDQLLAIYERISVPARLAFPEAR